MYTSWNLLFGLKAWNESTLHIEINNWVITYVKNNRMKRSFRLNVPDLSSIILKMPHSGRAPHRITWVYWVFLQVAALFTLALSNQKPSWLVSVRRQVAPLVCSGKLEPWMNLNGRQQGAPLNSLCASSAPTVHVLECKLRDCNSRRC